MNGKNIFYDTTIANIYQYRNQCIYYSLYRSYFKNIDLFKKADETIYYYFVYTKGKKYGLLFDERKSKSAIRVLADSMIKNEWSTQINVYQYFTYGQVTEISNNTNVPKGELSKSFIFRLKSDTTVKATGTFNFTYNLSNIPYSFSKELDSIYRMKLYNAKIMQESSYMKKGNITLDGFEDLYNLEEITVTNKKKLLKYFDADRLENLKQKQH